MKPIIYHTCTILNQTLNKAFVNIFSTDHLNVAIQKIDGFHQFNHINKLADEHIIILNGTLSIWTINGICKGKAGDIISIPRGLEHGNIKGINARIIVLENN